MRYKLELGRILDLSHGEKELDSFIQHWKQRELVGRIIWRNSERKLTGCWVGSATGKVLENLVVVIFGKCCPVAPLYD